MPVATTPSLTAISTPCPAVQISFTGLTASSNPTKITVWRIADGLTEQVRNAVATDVTGQTTFVVTDYEAPLGINTIYYASMTYSGVEQGNGPQASITVNDSRMWISDPLNPTNSTPVQLGGLATVTLGKNSFEQQKRLYKYNRSNVIGQQRPVMQFYGQKGIEGATFEIYTYGAGDNAIDNLTVVSPVLIRPPAAMLNLPARLYGVMEASFEPQTWRYESQPLNLWNITFNETAPQALGVVLSVYSYAYWSNRFPGTYASVTATTYGSNSYSYALLNPPA